MIVTTTDRQPQWKNGGQGSRGGDVGGVILVATTTPRWTQRWENRGHGRRVIYIDDNYYGADMEAIEWLISSKWLL